MTLGIYTTWNACSAQVENYPNNCGKRFDTLKEAHQAYCMSKVEQTPLQPLQARASKIDEGKGGGLTASVSIKDVIIVVLDMIVVYL